MQAEFDDPTGGPSSLVEILGRRARQQPEGLAYSFLTGEGDGEISLTYRELDRQARSIAARLHGCGAGGGRALLLYPPGLDFVAAFFGCLCAGVAAVPVYPPHRARPERTLPKIRAIADNARPSVALTTAPILAAVDDLLAQDTALGAMHWAATDDLVREGAGDWREPAVDGGSVAFLQYTSGSTGAPKGVVLTHDNLLHNLSLIQRAFEHTRRSRGVIWLPLYHDMGLIGGVLQALYLGVPATLMSPVTFLQRPFRWLEAISRTRATTSGGPNFAYDLCVRKITPEQRATLDLSSWEVAFNGAEPVRGQTLERFAATFAPCGFRREAFFPCYGLAEATLFVAGGPKSAPPVTLAVQAAALTNGRVVPTSGEDADAQNQVGCGAIPADQQVVIVDPDTLARCPPDRVGEIWIAGPSVARGYWNRPEETEQAFGARLAGGGEGPFLRTGDLGFVRDGELFVTGRLKDLIIIGGRNHYPQDIERTVEERHPAIRPGCCAAFSAEIAGEERLVIVAEVERRFRALAQPSSEVGEVVRALRRAVAEGHDLHLHTAVLLKPGSIPKTSSGKIQRHACRIGFQQGSLDIVEEHR